MRNNRWKMLNIAIPILAILLTVWINPVNVFANTSTETVAFLRGHSDWLMYGNFIIVMGTFILWAIVKFIFWIVSGLEGLIPQSVNLLGFLDDEGMAGFARAILTDLVVVLMILTILFIGFKVIVAKEPPKLKSVGVNIMVSTFLIMGMPTLMATMENISTEFYDSATTGNSNGNLAWSLIQNNTSDLLYVATNGFERIQNGSGSTVKNGLTPSNFGLADLSTLSSLVTPEDIKELKDTNSDLEHLKSVITVDGTGNIVAEEIKESSVSMFTDFFDTGYLRFTAKFFPIMVGLLALGCAYIFAIFVVVSTVIEIGIKRLVGYFVFATDLESGQRTKMVVQDIMNAFMLIAFTGLNFRIYTMFLSYIASADLNMMLYLVAIVSATFALIKGSSTIMRYFGVDTGVKDGLGQLAGALGLATAFRGMKNIGKGHPTNANGGKEKLSEQGADAPSINDESDIPNSSGGGLTKSVNSAGKALGYMRDRGLGGMAEDVIKGTGETISQTAKSVTDSVGNTAKSLKDGVTENVKSVSDSAKEGYQEGVLTGQSNREKWESQKKATINNGDNAGNVNGGSNEDKSNSLSGAQKQRLEQELNPVNTNTPKEEKVRVTEEREAINGQNSSSIQNEAQTPANNKLNPSTDKSINHSEPQDVVQNTRLNPTTGQSTVNQQEVSQSINPGHSDNRSVSQEVNQELKTTSSNNSPLRQGSGQEVQSVPNHNGQTVRNTVVQDVQNVPNATGTATRQTAVQDIQPASNSSQTVRNQVVQDVQKQAVSMPQQATQRISQELQYVGVSNADYVKQRVIQEVEQHATGTPEMKQRVVQQLEKANIATPEQATQNVQHILSKSRLPQETQQIVQKVVQDVQKSGNGSTEALKQKVVQELENANFGHREPIKQVIMTEVDRAFTATPEQLTQNVKQVIETVETVQTTNNVNTTQTNKVGASNPYGFDFGLREEDRPKKTGRRFDIFK